MAKINPILIRDVSEGILQKIDNMISPPNSVYVAVNLLFHKHLGRAVLRKGITKLGNDLSGVCYGLYQFIKTDGSTKLLTTFHDGKMYSLETATWTERASGAMTSGTKVRFTTYLDTVVAVDGTAKKSSVDGVTWVATGGNFDVGNMPAGKYIIEWRDKVYVAGTAANPDRLHFSSLPIDGAVSWTDDTAGHIDIEPEDGAGGITGLAKVPGYLLIFKERSLKRWNGQTTFPEDLISVGAQNQEAIVLARQTVFYWNERGVFETQGGYPRKVSRRIQDIVDAVDPAYQVSGWSDKENVYFSIGDIEIEGSELSNCVIVYHLDSQSWALLSFPKDFRAWYGRVNNGETIIVGDATGNVWTLFEGISDDGADINWMLQWQENEIGYRSRYKELSRFIVFTERVNNATFFVKSETSDFEPKGKVNSNVEIITEDARGRYFKFKLIGSGTSAEIIGLEIPETNIVVSQQI